MADNSNTTLLVIGVLLVVLLTAGLTYYVTKGSAVTVPPVTNVTNETGEAPTITVRGEATKTVSPDQLIIGLTIESFGTNSSESQAQSASDTSKVKAALLAAGLNATEIQTSSYYTYPVYNESCYSGCYPYYYDYGYDYGYAEGDVVYEADASGAMLKDEASGEAASGVAYTDIAPMPPYPCKREGNCTILGYKTAHTITIKTAKTTEGGDFVDAALGSTNATKVDYVYFSLTEETRLEIESDLQADAAKAAKTKAENIASGLGATLGKIVSINPDYYYPYPMYAYDRSDVYAGGGTESATVPTEIFPTDYTMYSYITVVYELKQ